MDGGAPSGTGPTPPRASDDDGTPAHERLVEAGVQLVVEHHDRDAGAGRLRDVFPFLTLSGIAQRAGVSRGTIYHHWRHGASGGSGGTGVLERLLEDVAGELWARSVEPDRVLAAAAPRWSAPGGEPTLDDVVLEVSEVEAQRVSGPSQALVRCSQALTLHGVPDPRAVESLLDELAARYTATFAAFGGRVAEPLATTDVAFLLSATFEGVALGASSGRDVLERRFPRPGARADGPSDDVSLTSVVVHAILAATLTDVASAGPAPGGPTADGADATDRARPTAADPAGAAPAAKPSAGEVTRRRVIDAAVELALEHYAEPGPVDPRVSLAHLTPGAVARRAGTSRPLLYHHWGDGADAFRCFLDDVVAEVWRRSAVPGELLDAADEVGPDASELVRVLSNSEGRRLLGPDGPLIRAAQALLLDGLVDASAAREVTEGLAEMHRELAAASGFVPVAGLSFLDVATAIELLCEGYWLQGNVLPERLERTVRWSSRVAGTADGPTTPTDDWTLFAIAVDALLAAMLEPADGAVSSRRPPGGRPSRPG